MFDVTIIIILSFALPWFSWIGGRIVNLLDELVEQGHRAETAAIWRGERPRKWGPKRGS